MFPHGVYTHNQTLRGVLKPARRARPAGFRSPGRGILIANEPGAEVLEHLRRLEARATPGLMAQVIPIFIDDTSERLVTLREAVLRRDGDTVRQVAHTLHGSAASVGASSMMVGCAAVIEGVRLGEFERCEAFVAELVADFESIRRAAEATGV